MPHCILRQRRQACFQASRLGLRGDQRVTVFMVLFLWLWRDGAWHANRRFVTVGYAVALVFECSGPCFDGGMEVSNGKVNRSLGSDAMKRLAVEVKDKLHLGVGPVLGLIKGMMRKFLPIAKAKQVFNALAFGGETDMIWRIEHGKVGSGLASPMKEGNVPIVDNQANVSVKILLICGHQRFDHGGEFFDKRGEFSSVHSVKRFSHLAAWGIVVIG